MRWLAMVSLAAAIGTTATSAETPAPAPDDAPVARWINNLQHPSFNTREEAEARLIELGLDAVPALRELMDDEAAPLEARHRAKRAWHQVAYIAPNERQPLRAQAERAMAEGRWSAAIEAYAKLALQTDVPPDDLIALGHAYDLSHDFDQAVAAYVAAAERLDLLLREGLHSALAGEAGDEAGDAGDAVEPAHLDVLAALQQVKTHEHRRLRPLFEQRWKLIALAARIHTGERDDPAAAVQLVTAALVDLPAMQQDAVALLKHRRDKLADHVARRLDVTAHRRAGRDLAGPVAALRELAAAHEKLGQLEAAIDTLNRVALWRVTYALAPPADETDWLGTLVNRWQTEHRDDGASPPETPTLHLLTPDQPSRTFIVDDPDTMARTHGYTRLGGSHSNALSLAFIPPPDLEFATIAIKLDARIPYTTLGFVHGRSVTPIVAQPPAEGDRFDLPPGAGLFRTRFQPRRQPDDAPARWSIQATFRPRTIDPAFAAGAVWSHERQGQPDSWQPPESPFRWQQTNLPAMRLADHPVPVPHTHLAPLPDGRWLLAFVNGGLHDRRIFVATSADLLEWSTPQPLPVLHGNTADAPALGVDAQGNVWLAYFCDRLNTATAAGNSNAPVHLWLCHTRDGKTWSQPRGIVGAERHLRPQPPQLRINPVDNTCWIFHGNRGASAAAFGDISVLTTLDEELPEGLDQTPGFAFDDSGRLHTVYGDRQGNLHHRTRIGRNWSPPRVILAGDGRRQRRNPQLLLRGSSAAIILHGDQLIPGRLEEGDLILNESFPFTHPSNTTQGGHVHLTAKGELLTLTCDSRVLLLRCRIEDTAPSE